MSGERTNVDPAFMDLALALARRSRPSPNPQVGAVVVRDGVVIGRGHHEVCGGPHAEINALAEAGAAARGADLYVTLEPCCHRGQTGPCTEQIQASGVGRVVVGVVDPDPRVSGRGIVCLEERGFEVVRGLREEACRSLLAGYFVHRSHGRPLIQLKAAITVDGRIATAGGRSRWISGEASRAWAHELRAEADAVLVGVETVLADDPLLTVRHVAGRNPVRVVLDSRLRTPVGSRLVASAAEAPVLLVHTAAGRAAAPGFDGIEGVERLECPEAQGGGVDLARLAERLGDRGVLSLLVEGGARVHGAFVAAGLADLATLFVAPRVFGSGLGWLDLAGVETTDDGPALEFLRAEPLGQDLALRVRFRGSAAIEPSWPGSADAAVPQQ